MLLILGASTDAEIDAAFARAVQFRLGAVLVGTDSFYLTVLDKIVATAINYGIPAFCPIREYTAAGGFASYGDKRPLAYREAGQYVGKLLAGARVVDLPVLFPTTFELVVNLKIAKSLGLTIPESFLVRADEVIE